jgi:hypothetical protein
VAAVAAPGEEVGISSKKFKIIIYIKKAIMNFWYIPPVTFYEYDWSFFSLRFLVTRLFLYILFVFLLCTFAALQGPYFAILCRWEPRDGHRLAAATGFKIQI